MWEEKTRVSSGDTGENMMVEGEGETLCFFFVCEDEVAVLNDVPLVMCSFSMRSCSS